MAGVSTDIYRHTDIFLHPYRLPYNWSTCWSHHPSRLQIHAHAHYSQLAQESSGVCVRGWTVSRAMSTDGDYTRRRRNTHDAFGKSTRFMYAWKIPTYFHFYRGSGEGVEHTHRRTYLPSPSMWSQPVYAASFLVYFTILMSGLLLIYLFYIILFFYYSVICLIFV